MKKVQIYFGLLVFSLLGFVACKKQDPAPLFHYEYFDLTQGRYIDYNVIEIQHDVTQTIQHDTLRYQLRTLIGDTVIDNEGRIARKFYRFKRATSADNWLQSDLWTAIITNNRAELVEENQRIIKLVFAPTILKEWNINSFNVYPELIASYANIHDSWTNGSISFDSTLTVVLEENNFNMIEHKHAFDVYAKGVGLVEKHYKKLAISNFDTLNVQEGKELYYTIIGYGF